MPKKKDPVAADLAGRGMLTPKAQITNTREKRNLVYEIQEVDRKEREIVLKSSNHYRGRGAIIIRPTFETVAKKFTLVTPAPAALEDGGKTWTQTREPVGRFLSREEKRAAAIRNENRLQGRVD